MVDLFHASSINKKSQKTDNDAHESEQSLYTRQTQKQHNNELKATLSCESVHVAMANHILF